MLENSRDIFIKNETNEVDAKILIDKIFKENWFTGYDYSQTTIKKFKSSARDILINNFELVSVALYIRIIVNAYNDIYTNNDNNFFKQFPFIKKEIETYVDKGGLCIYISVLATTLLNEISRTKDYKYIQGYCEYKIDKTAGINVLLHGQLNQVIQLHSFISKNNNIYDFSFYIDNATFLNLDDSDILCEYDDKKINFYGYEETDETLEKYCEDIANISKLGSKRWITRHGLICLKTCLEETNAYLKELKEEGKIL